MVEDLSWMLLGLCREVAGDIWYPESGESAEPALGVCRSCEVRARCVRYALEHNERFGIWGVAESERRQMRKAGRATWPKIVDIAA